MKGELVLPVWYQPKALTEKSGVDQQCGVSLDLNNSESPKYFDKLLISKIFFDINYLFNLLWILFKVLIADL